MVSSTCIKCGNHSFQIVENSPSGAAFKLMFVQCGSCGGVVGIQDYFNIGSLIKDQEKQIKRLQSCISDIEFQVSQIYQRIR
jgi:excinuclease UvrABC ATPase subunit